MQLNRASKRRCPKVLLVLRYPIRQVQLLLEATMLKSSQSKIFDFCYSRLCSKLLRLRFAPSSLDQILGPISWISSKFGVMDNKWALLIHLFIEKDSSNLALIHLHWNRRFQQKERKTFFLYIFLSLKEILDKHEMFIFI